MKKLITIFSVFASMLTYGQKVVKVHGATTQQYTDSINTMNSAKLTTDVFDKTISQARSGDVFYNIIDPYTGENTTFKKTTTWRDGTSMSDAKIDSFIYRKKGSEYFKRVILDKINVQWFGVLPSNTAAQNNTAVTYMISAIPTGSNIEFPEGSYLFSQTITITKSLNISGRGNWGTLIVNTGVGTAAFSINANIERGSVRDIRIDGNGILPYGTDATSGRGFVFHNNSVHWTFNNVWMRGHGDDYFYADSTGHINNINIIDCKLEYGRTSAIHFIQNSFGSQVNAVMISGCNISSFGGNGIEVWGNSISIENNSIQACKGRGIVADGANGYQSSSCQSLRIQNNYFEGCNYGFIKLGSYTSALPGYRYMLQPSIIGNYGGYSKISGTPAFDASSYALVEIVAPNWYAYDNLVVSGLVYTGNSFSPGPIDDSLTISDIINGHNVLSYNSIIQKGVNSSRFYANFVNLGQATVIGAEPGEEIYLKLTGGTLTGSTTIQSTSNTVGLNLQAGGGVGFRFGAKLNSNLITANTSTLARMGMPAYDSVSTAIMLSGESTGANTNNLYFGGHPGGSPKTMTSLNFVTGINGSMTGGLNRGNINNAGTFSWGSASQFQFDSAGNIIKINGVTTSWPSSQGAANTYLKNNGSGVYTWASLGSTLTTSDTAAMLANYATKLNLHTDSINSIHAQIVGLASTTATNTSNISSNTSSIALKANIATPTFTTNITTPVVIGGTGTASQLTLQSTSNGSPISGSDIIFKPGTTETMRLLNAGYLGIGTPSPNVPLHVLSSGTAAKFQAGGGTGAMVIGADVNASTVSATTRKLARVTMPSWDAGATNTFMFSGDITSSAASDLYIGGAVGGSQYAMSGIHFVTGATSTTTGGTEKATILSSGNFGIGQSTPTAVLHLKAGTATASSAPLKFTSGTNLTTAEDGAVEYNGTDLQLDVSTTRYVLAKTLQASSTLDFGSTAAQNSTDLTITVTGAAVNDEVSVGAPNGSVLSNSSYSAWISASNTVTVRFNNYSSGAQDPSSGTFRVSVIKH